MKTLERVHFPGDENGFHFGAFDCEAVEQKLIGIVSFYLENNPDVMGCSVPATQLRVRGVAVEPQYRSQGLGSQLLQFGIKYFTDKYGSIYVWLNGRTSASRFYERLGFQKKGEEYESSEGTGPHWVFEMVV